MWVYVFVYTCRIGPLSAMFGRGRKMNIELPKDTALKKKETEMYQQNKISENLD